MRERLRGFTLVEMMIVIALASILMLVVVPTFQETVKNNRLFRQSNDFYSTLMRARSEAMSRVQRVTVCASSDQATCTGTWSDGWIVFEEDIAQTDGTVDTGEDILHVVQALSDGNTLAGTTDVATYISYMGTGFTETTGGGAQAGNLVLCDDRGMDKARVIRLTAVGQSRVIAAADQSDIGACDASAPP